MLFTPIFQITAHDSTDQVQTQQNIQVSRLIYTSSQIQQRQVNFIQRNQLLVTIPLNQFDRHGDQYCLSASIPRSIINSRFASIDETQRAAAIYNWLFNMRSSILEAYGRADQNHSTFAFDLSQVPITPQQQLPVQTTQVANLPPTAQATPPQVAVQPVPTQRTLPTVVPRPLPVTAESRTEHFMSVISLYQGYISEALRRNPNDRVHIEQNYRTIFYGPSEDRLHGNICLADQIQRDRLLTNDQKANLIRSLEVLISRAPTAQERPAPISPTQNPPSLAPTQPPAEVLLPAEPFTSHQRQNLRNQIRTRQGNNDALLPRALADRLSGLLIDLSAFNGFRNRFSSEGDIINEAQSGYLDFVHTLPAFINTLNMSAEQRSTYQSRATDLIRDIEAFVGSAQTEPVAPPVPAPTVVATAPAFNQADINMAREISFQIQLPSITGVLAFSLPTEANRREQILRDIIQGLSQDPRFSSLRLNRNRPDITALQRSLLSQTSISADLSDLWSNRNLPPLTANGEINIQTFAALAIYRWRAIHPDVRTNPVGSWDESRSRAPPVAPSVPAPVVAAPVAGRSAAVVAMVNAVIIQANPASLIANHNYPESEVSAAAVAIYTDLLLPATAGPIAERFRAFVGSQRPRNDDERRRLLLQFYQREHNTISRDLPALWSAFNHSSRYYPPGSNVPEFIAALALINWRLSHPNLSEYPAGRWDLQAPMQAPVQQPPAPPTVVTSAESGGDLLASDSAPITRARLARSEQQIYDNVIRGNVSDVLRASIPTGRGEIIFRAIINGSTLRDSFGVSDDGVAEVQREILADRTIAADLPDLWTRSRLAPLTANGEANIQTLAALALFRWRELHPATATRPAPEVGRWDPNYRPGTVAPSSPVVAPPPQPAVVAPAPAETVTTGRITQVQNNLILDTIMGSNIAIPNSTGRRPRFARLFENISAISSNPEFFARQLYYFYTDQIRNNDQFVVVGLTGMTPASDRFYMAHAYLRAGGLTLDQANNLTGYRTVLINALRQLVILDGSPYVIDSSNVITRERLGHRIEPLRSELSTLLTRAGYNPSFLSVNATPTDIQNAPLEVVLLAISYVEWRVRNQGASLNFDQWIPQAGVAVQARPAQPPATQTVVAPLTAAPTIDANLVTQLTDQVTDLHTAFDTVQATRNQIGAQLVLARTAVTNRNQAALDAAKNEVTRLIRTLSNYEGTDGAVEEANREINRLLPRTDRRRNTPPYQQLITQATGFGSQVTSLIGQARADQTTVNALVIAEDQNAQRQSAQQEYNQAKQNLDAAIALFRNDVTYCRDQLALATTASRANNFVNFTTARDNLNARLGLVRGPANATDQQITLSDLTSLMTALRSANDRLNAVDPSSRTRRVDELNGYTRTINGGAGSFVNTLNGFESDLRRLRTPAAPTFVPPPLSAADRALLRDMPQAGPVYVPQGSPQTPQDNVQVAPSAVVTSATFGQAMPARRDDGGFVGSGSASNPYVIDVPLPGISEPINNIRQFPSPQAGGPPVYIRVQFRPLSSADTNQVSLQSISSSISSAIVTLLGNGRPLDIGYRRNITGMGSYRDASSNLTDFAPALRELADRNTALRARLRR